MKYNIAVALDDMIDALSMVHDHEEILESIVSLDRSQSDVQFTMELIQRLVLSLGEDLESEGTEETEIMVEVNLPLPGLSDVQITAQEAVTLDSIIESLSTQDPYLLVSVMAKAFGKRATNKEDKVEAVDPEKVLCDCGHPLGVHNNEDGLCVAFKEARDCMACAANGEDPVCTRCGCPRIRHCVNVGGERTGCFNHHSCDEWEQEKK